MARGVFSTSDYLRASSSPLVLADPYTILVWVYPTGAFSVTERIVDFHLSSAANTRSSLGLGRGTGDTLSVRSADTGGTAATFTTATFNVGAWNSCIGTAEVNNGNRYPRLNGSNGTTSSSRSNYGAVDQFNIGITGGNAAGDAATKLVIGEVAVWNVQLSTAEMEALEAGYSPLMVRPESLLSYIPMHGRNGTGGEEDWVGSYSLTATGTPAVDASHPRIIYPKRQIWVPKASAGGSFTSSGSLASQAATLAGTATRLALHSATGALSAQAATVAGAAVHPHIATGALEAQAATVDGTAARSGGAASFTSDGALAAAAAAVDGTAAHYTLHAFTGSLEAQAAAVAGTATHLTLHTATGALVAGSASVSGAAVDETTFVPAVPNKGGGKSRKARKKRYQVEINGEVHEVASVEEAEAVLEQVAKQAEETAKTAIERASRAKRRPARKVLADARKTLEVPEISVPADFRDIANQIIGRIKADYQSALSSIEISAHLARREREIEEDDEDILMLI